MHISSNIRLLASVRVAASAKLHLPENEPGSSIMPGKVNPTQNESLTMICAQVIGCDAAITVANTHEHFQPDVFKPVIISNFLMAAGLLAMVVFPLTITAQWASKPTAEPRKFTHAGNRAEHTHRLRKCS
ncbi:MAG: lyase family protein [Bacteroidales bacterium]